MVVNSDLKASADHEICRIEMFYYLFNQESPCVNTCDEMGAAEREESERQARLAEEGLKVKADLIERGKELK